MLQYCLCGYISRGQSKSLQHAKTTSLLRFALQRALYDSMTLLIYFAILYCILRHWCDDVGWAYSPQPEQAKQPRVFHARWEALQCIQNLHEQKFLKQNAKTHVQMNLSMNLYLYTQ